MRHEIRCAPKHSNKFDHFTYPSIGEHLNAIAHLDALQKLHYTSPIFPHKDRRSEQELNKEILPPYIIQELDPEEVHELRGQVKQAALAWYKFYRTGVAGLFPPEAVVKSDAIRLIKPEHVSYQLSNKQLLEEVKKLIYDATIDE